MKVIRKIANFESTRLEDFANAHDLTLVITEMRMDHGISYMAKFDGVRRKNSDGTISESCGSGSSERMAMAQYADAIEHCTIIIGSGDQAKTVKCPALKL